MTDANPETDYCGIVVMDDELLALGKGITEEEWHIAKDREGVMTILIRDENGGAKKHIAALSWADTEGGMPDARAIAAVPRLFARIEQDAATIAELRAALVRARRVISDEFCGNGGDYLGYELKLIDAALKPTSNEGGGA